MSILSHIKRLFGQPVGADNLKAFDQFRGASDSFLELHEAVGSFSIRADQANGAGSPPYTIEYLSSHTEAIEKADKAFDGLSKCFNSLPRGSKRSSSAAELFQAHAKTYAFTAEAYQKSAQCALLVAAEGKLQAAEDEFKQYCLDGAAANASEAMAAAAQEEAESFRQLTAGKAATFDRLNQAAERAHQRAGEILLKARSAGGED